MSRGRIITPDFWTDSAVIRMSPFARLFYIGTWNFALCDKGHLPDDALGLKLKILPADNVDADELLGELITAGRIMRVSTDDGKRFLFIPTFASWQKQDSRWTPRCPVCRDSLKLTETHPSFGELTETHQTTPELTPEGRGGELRGEEIRGGETAPPRKCSKHLHDRTSPNCFACRDARLEREDWDKAQKNKLTSVSLPPRDKNAGLCVVHANYPMPCDRCAEEAS